MANIFDRRDFLKTIGLGAAALTAPGWPTRKSASGIRNGETTAVARPSLSVPFQCRSLVFVVPLAQSGLQSGRRGRGT